MMNNKLTRATLILALLFSTPAMAADKTVTFKEYLEKANNYIKSYRHFEASDALKEATKLGGAKHPSLHMRLGILYYGLGLLEKAIAEGEKAVALAPSSKWYKYDLAKFYFVDKRFDKAAEQFTALLKIDPGFTLGYYYLAELYTQKKEYDMAWLSLQRARMLGFQGKELEDKLAAMTSKPTENFAQIDDNSKLFRFIKLPSSEKAQLVLEEIWKGKLFENLELELKKDKSNQTDFGVMMLSELSDSVAGSLHENEPYSVPVIVKTGPDYRIMQRIVPFDPTSWGALTSSAPPTAQAIPPKMAADSTPPKEKTNQPAVASVPASTTIAPAEKIDTPPPASDTPEPHLSAKLAAFYALENWQIAWETQDLDGYLSIYSNDFKPLGNVSLNGWKKKRKKSLARPKYISLDIQDPVVEMLTDTQLLITFKQNYESNSYKDTVIKTLTMAKEQEGWKIIQEREIEKIAQ